MELNRPYVEKGSVYNSLSRYNICLLSAQGLLINNVYVLPTEKIHIKMDLTCVNNVSIWRCVLDAEDELLGRLAVSGPSNPMRTVPYICLFM